MIADSSKGLFDIVLVWKLDRFSRDRYDSAHYKHILKKNGARVISIKENISDGPEGMDRAVALLNFRPRKCLGWRTPYEVFYDQVLQLT